MPERTWPGGQRARQEVPTRSNPSEHSQEPEEAIVSEVPQRMRQTPACIACVEASHVGGACMHDPLADLIWPREQTGTQEPEKRSNSGEQTRVDEFPEPERVSLAPQGARQTPSVRTCGGVQEGSSAALAQRRARSEEKKPELVWKEGLMSEGKSSEPSEVMSPRRIAAQHRSVSHAAPLRPPTAPPAKIWAPREGRTKSGDYLSFFQLDAVAFAQTTAAAIAKNPHITLRSRAL
jgi:hypothetical protein